MVFMMKSTANTATVQFTDGREVLLSYGVPVAAFVPGLGYVKTERFYSRTTSRHVNDYAGKGVTVIAADAWAELVQPLQVR